MFHHEHIEQQQRRQASLSASSSPATTPAASPYWGPLTRGHASKPEATETIAATPRGTHVTITTQGFSKWVAFCFTINYILGTGFLTVPWAFCRGGLILSTLCMLVVGVLSDMAKNYLLETMAYAEAMLDETMHWKSSHHHRKTKKGSEQPPQTIQVYSPKVMGPSTTTTQKTIVSTSPFLKLQQEQRRAQDRDNTEDDDDEEQQALETSSLLGGRGGGGRPPKPNATKNYNSSSLPGSPAGPTAPPAGRRAMVLTTTTTASHGQTNNKANNNPQPQQPDGHMIVGQRKFEVNTLCRVYLGKHSGLKLYTACLCLYIYCTLWAYTCVFASAMAKMAPLDHVMATILGWFQTNHDNDLAIDSYLMYAVLFSTAVVPLSCMELDEQVVVQVLMTLARFVMLFFMLGTSGELAAQQQQQDGTVFEPAPLVRWQGLSEMLPIVVFSQIFHHSVPGLSQPVANKRELKTIFMSTAVFATVAYALLGLTLGSAFGTAVEQSSNLHWNDYHSATSSSWWTQFVSIYVVCFPALDVVSAFPLNAITLGNNMLASFYGSKIHEAENNRWIRTQFRLLASVPPIILGILERKLGTITDYAGTTGFVLGFSFPALLFLKSQQKAIAQGFPSTTAYVSYATKHAGIPWSVFVFGLGMAAYAVYFLVLAQVQGEESNGEK